MAVGTVLIVSGLLAALLFGGGDDEAAEADPRKPGRKKREPIGPIPLPEEGDDDYLTSFDAIMCECSDTLGAKATAEQLRDCIAATLYPEVPFPPIEGDDSSVDETWGWIGDRVASFLATDRELWCPSDKKLDPDEADDGKDENGKDEKPPAPTPFDILAGLTSDKPMPGKFYKIGSRADVPAGEDTFSQILREALNNAVPGAGHKSSLRTEYGYLVTSGPRWNMRLYASTKPADNLWPEYRYVNGQSLRRGWKAWHAGVRQKVAQGKMPARAITAGGSRIDPHVGSDYGYLWLPPLDVNLLEQGVVTTGTLGWSDESTVLDPPPEILEFIK